MLGVWIETVGPERDAVLTEVVAKEDGRTECSSGAPSEVKGGGYKSVRRRFPLIWRVLLMWLSRPSSEIMRLSHG